MTATAATSDTAATAGTADTAPGTATAPAAPPAPAPAAVRPYQHYVYAYPHKTAYRPLPRADAALRALWADEPKDALSLYFHIPFCEVRCGFCNLFTRIGAPDGLTTAYLDALERQAAAVREALGDGARFADAAFGGGTPTFLTAAELERLCDLAEHGLGADLTAAALSVEASPATATADRLAVLAARGATRLSLGVQSFDDAEARAAVRPQRRADVEAALGRIRDAGIPVLNIDLIYGIAGQTEASWRRSLDAALAWHPEELYLYPLYVRPLTGLGRRRPPEPEQPEGRRARVTWEDRAGQVTWEARGSGEAGGGGAAAGAAWDAQRLRLYRHGRDHLLAAGYEQVSMRMFRRPDAPATGGEDHTCQTDGMVGLGCGARSYTSALHYSFDYAVGMHRIRRIIDDYTARTTEDFRYADFGWRMDAQEARRRHLLQSLLQAEGMSVDDYRARFGTSPADDFAADLTRFRDRGWLADPATDHSAAEGPATGGPATDGSATGGSAAGARLRLTPEGLAHSDALGPELFSAAVRERMAAYAWK